MSRRPFRFTASADDVLDRGSLVELARRAESLGYDALVLSDHLVRKFAPLPALVTIAEATRRLRVGTFVFNNDLRHPAVLAQELATIDELTGGRLEIGVGAGWNEEEYRQSGLSFDAPGTRISRMEEAITVLKGLLAGEPLSFAGRHYRIDALDCCPKPVQRPHPPFIVGGGGRRVLSIAGREAQIVSLAPRLAAPDRPDVRGCLAGGTAEKVEWVRAAAGDRFEQIEITTYPPFAPVTVTDDPRSTARRVVDLLRERFGAEVGEDELLASPHVFVGSIDSLVEKCVAMREQLGISSVMVRGAIDAFAPVVERLAS